VRIWDGVGGLRDGWGECDEEGGDPWLGAIPLCERLGHLFNLTETKSSTVAKMYSLR
jgi:hypothetical protein